jgi:hypothetical protein
MHRFFNKATTSLSLYYKLSTPDVKLRGPSSPGALALMRDVPYR